MLLDEKPVGIYMVLGVPSISALAGWRKHIVESLTDVSFCGNATLAATERGSGDSVVNW